MADNSDWDDRESPSQSSDPDIVRLERLEEESTSRWVHELSRDGSSQEPADSPFTNPSTTDIVNVDTARMPSRVEQHAFNDMDTARMPSRISRTEYGDVDHRRAPSRILQTVNIDTGRMPSRMMRIVAGDTDTRLTSRNQQAGRG
jgi:hypothetical protein